MTETEGAGTTTATPPVPTSVAAPLPPPSVEQFQAAFDALKAKLIEELLQMHERLPANLPPSEAQITALVNEALGQTSNISTLLGGVKEDLVAALRNYPLPQRSNPTAFAG